MNRSLLLDLVQPFTFGLMAALVRVVPQSASASIVDGLLKQLLVRIYESEMKWTKHTWIAKLMSGEEKRLSACLLKPSECRLLASEPVYPGFLDLLLDTLDTNGVRMIQTSLAVTLKDHLTIYASRMLRDLFRVSICIRLFYHGKKYTKLACTSVRQI